MRLLPLALSDGNDSVQNDRRRDIPSAFVAFNILGEPEEQMYVQMRGSLLRSGSLGCSRRTKPQEPCTEGSMDPVKAGQPF